MTLMGRYLLRATLLKSLLGLCLASAALVVGPALCATPVPRVGSAMMPTALRLALHHVLAGERASSDTPAPWIEQAVSSSDGAAGDVFGFSVAIDGDTALIGAAEGAAAPTGTDNGGTGAVYVFKNLPATGWTEVQKLTADDGVDNDQFGYSIALQGSTAIIGAAFAQVGGNGHQGAVYVFTLSVDTWMQAAKLVADDGASSDQLGWSVALDGDTAVLGAPGATLTPGFATGAAYVFTRSGDTWSQTAKLTADDGAAQDAFGFGVAVHGTTAIATSVNATVGANAVQGASYVFSSDGGSWTQVTKLVADDGVGGDSLGYAAAFDGTTAMISAPFATIGSNPFQGAVYAFADDGGTWSQVQKIFSPEGMAVDAFGISVTMSGPDLVVTAPFYNASQGEAFLFSNPDGSGWTEQHTFTASDAIPGQGWAFGYAAAVSQGQVVVGSVFNMIGNNAYQGAAYFYANDEIFGNGFD